MATYRKFADPIAQAALAKQIAGHKSAGTWQTWDNAGGWALAAGCIPWVPSNTSIACARTIGNAAWLFGQSDPRLAGIIAEQQAIFDAQKVGWLGSILGAVAEPVAIGIAGFIAAPLVGAIAGAGAGTAVSTLIGDPLKLGAGALNTTTGVLPVTPPALVAPVPSWPAWATWAAAALVAYALVNRT